MLLVLSSDLASLVTHFKSFEVSVLSSFFVRSLNLCHERASLPSLAERDVKHVIRAFDLSNRLLFSQSILSSRTSGNSNLGFSATSRALMYATSLGTLI